MFPVLGCLESWSGVARYEMQLQVVKSSSSFPSSIAFFSFATQGERAFCDLDFRLLTSFLQNHGCVRLMEIDGILHLMISQ